MADRFLLAIDNRKLGSDAGIGHFDLPAGHLTCPGRTPACEAVCYAQRSRFHFPNVVDRLHWCYQQSLRKDFEARMVREVRVRGIRLIRVHVSGDYFSAEYAEKWRRIMRRLPRVRFWFYSRSWRIPEIEVVLRRMALLKNCKVWYSLDVDTGFPAERPLNVQYAFMQSTPQGVQNVELIFRTRNMVNAPRVGLPMVCPSDTPAGRAAGANCSSCGRCFED